MSEVFGFLFARPTFLAGLASVLDVGATLVEINQSPTPEQADYIALKADMQAIAEDFRKIIKEANAMASK